MKWIEMLLFFNLLVLKVYLKNSFLTNLAKVHETTGQRLKSHSPRSAKICPTFSEKLFTAAGAVYSQCRQLCVWYWLQRSPEAFIKWSRLRRMFRFSFCRLMNSHQQSLYNFLQETQKAEHNHHGDVFSSQCHYYREGDKQHSLVQTIKHGSTLWL